LDKWETIRLRCVRDGEPIKVVARELGLSRNTLRKYIRGIMVPHAKPRKRERLLDIHQAQIDELLRQHPRITAARIGRVLREADASLSFEESTLRKYVASRRRLIQPREAFVRAMYEPGDQAQFDFSPVNVTIAGVLTAVHLFVMRLSYSGRYFARISLRYDRPALFAGILGALQAFDGIPREAIFDNASSAVKRILRGRNREQNAVFSAFCGALALDIQFAAPAKGNEKGGVEGINRYLQNNFFLPTPAFASLEECNAVLARACELDAGRMHSEHRETIAARFLRERDALRKLPQHLPRACVPRYTRVNKFSEVVYETTRYSVPTKFAYRDAMLEIYDDRVRVIIDDAVVAEHARAVEKHTSVLEPRHYLDLLSHKHRAAERAAAFAGGRLPNSLIMLRDRYIERDRPAGTKAWMQVVALLRSHSTEAVDAAVRQALEAQTDDPAAIALLLQGKSTAATVTLDLAQHPELAAFTGAEVDISRYAIAALVEVA
jgi:transposase